MNTLGAALIAETKKRIIGESLPRIKKCVGLLTEEELWLRPNSETVSVGNLVLHLCGNVRQWICTGLGGQPDHRQREKEFSETGPLPAEELMRKLETTLRDAEAVLDALDPNSLLELRPVQIYYETGVSILVHVTEHFSYHTGQITYFTKMRKGVDTGYYAGQNLSGKKP